MKGAWLIFKDRGLTNWAAALTYYSVMSLFPALIAVISILGLIGSSAIQPLIDNVTTIAPGPARDLLLQSLNGLQDNANGSGVILAISIVLAVWAASGYVSGFMSAGNAIYGTAETRPIWKKYPTRYFITLVCLLLLGAGAFAVVVTGDIARRFGDVVGIGATVTGIWDVAKWPVLVLAVAFLLAILYAFAPDVRHERLRSLAPGALLAIAIWIVASLLFAAYVANFGSYNKTYGALGGIVVFLVWLYISNLAVLLGATFNAAREIEHGTVTAEAPKVDAEDEPPTVVEGTAT
jgi:membrane protein